MDSKRILDFLKSHRIDLVQSMKPLKNGSSIMVYEEKIKEVDELILILENDKPF